jgi:hypothetical protein
VRAAFAAALVFVLPSAQADAQTENVTRVAKAGHEAGIGHALQWNKKCEPRIPKLVLTVPPDHGSICARDYIAVARRNVVSDDQTCIGKRIRGLQIIYLARSDYAGHDTVDYLIQFPGKTLSKHVDIEVRSGDATPAARLGEESISPGKAGDVIVACAPLSS